MSSIPYYPAAERPQTYLNWNYRVKSWLLTIDHKRIAILYMISITFFFFIGGAAAVLMRRHLPGGVFVDLHGAQFHRHDPQDARAGADVVPAAAVRLVALCDEHDSDPGHAGGGDHAGAGDRGAGVSGGDL